MSKSNLILIFLAVALFLANAGLMAIWIWKQSPQAKQENNSAEPLLASDKNAKILIDEVMRLGKTITSLEQQIDAINVKISLLPIPEKERFEKALKVLEILKALKNANAAEAPIHAKELVRHGDEAIVWISQRLKESNLADFREKPVLTGSTFLSYPGEEIALLDALRGIGTEAALLALAEGIKEVKSSQAISLLYAITENLDSEDVLNALKLKTREYIKTFEDGGSLENYARALEFAGQHLLNDPTVLQYFVNILKAHPKGKALDLANVLGKVLKKNPDKFDIMICDLADDAKLDMEMVDALNETLLNSDPLRLGSFLDYILLSAGHTPAKKMRVLERSAGLFTNDNLQRLPKSLKENLRKNLGTLAEAQEGVEKNKVNGWMNALQD